MTQLSEPAAPRLEFVYEAVAEVGTPIELGSAPDGERRIVPIVGEGLIRGPRISGRLLADAADWQVTRSDGVTVVDATYGLLLEDGTVVQVRNRGLRHASVDEVYFRTTPVFTAPAGPHEWMNRSVFVCSGTRAVDGIRLRVYRVL